MHLLDNTLLQGGKYRIRRFISSGGFGCTYEAEHVLLEKRVAIKEFFVKDFCNRDEVTFHVTVGTQSKKGLVEKMRLKFIDEAKSLCKLHHHGIVSVSDVFEENGTAYFVMDYVEGRSLREIVDQEGPLSEERAVRYIRQVAEALQHVHDNNCLHLDIKPGNIMINSEDRPVLIDFGASKQYDELDGENTSTLMGKTPGYAPPEQMSNSVVRFLPATDIYALGATLYKLLTGITPLDVNLRISGEELEPMPVNVSSGTQKAVSEAMQINKNNRPQDLSNFLKILDNQINSHANDEQAEETELPPSYLNIEIDMVDIKGGTFSMGSSWSFESDRDERPLHKVTVNSFRIGKNVVTQSQWKIIMGDNPSKHIGDSFPVVNASWNDVQEFIRRLNEKTGKHYRLPTEAEWEFAARGGNLSKGYKYSGSNSIEDVAWYVINSGKKLHPIGEMIPNELGIFDMSGNIAEWCQDWYEEEYYRHSPVNNPEGPDTGTFRVVRGGSCISPSRACRITYRGNALPDFSKYTIGFRLAESISY